MRRFVLSLLTSLSFVLACGSDDSVGGATSTCPADSPTACLGDDGALLGCCPTSHPVCSSDGLSCTAGGGGAAGQGGAGGSGAGGTSNGGAPGGGGTPSGGTVGTGGVGGTGGSGGTGGNPTGGTGGTGGVTTCSDEGFEPNETEAQATDLGSMTDCNSTGKTVFGDLNGSGDVDFYTVAASDVFGCVVDPEFEMTTQARLCVFFECTGLSVDCKDGATPTTSPGGRLGCCIPNGGTLEATPDCSGADDSTTMYIRVDQGPAGVCTPYSVKFHY